MFAPEIVNNRLQWSAVQLFLFLLCKIRLTIISAAESLYLLTTEKKELQ